VTCKFDEIAGEWLCVSLANSLSRKAKSVFDLLDPEMINDYQFIKIFLLKAFNVDEESCKAKFDNAKLFQGETMAQFLVRLTGQWRKWEQISEIEKHMIA